PVSLSEIRPFINYTYFYKCWNVRPGSSEADALLADAEDMLDSLEAQGASMTAQVAFYGAYSEGDFIKAGGESIYTPRQNPAADGTPGKALSDYVAPEGAGDHIGCFLVTVGETIRTRLEEYAGSDDSYSRLLLQSLADRLAEAASEWLHRQTRVSLWGYSPDEPLDYQAIRRGEYRGIRPAVGYPSLPDQRLMHTLMRLLRPDDAGVSVTVNGALSPSASVAGFYLASPRARYFMVNPSRPDRL
ncbi:MAG: 5-methyltetrahydrofolate--homocysteine methyltransferase, partial [Muribaculaceae bacterium]|nr:5-methyltetrahydrofolate--homocysteine methyltransferase [Muribaculaceae bacterium]